MSPVVDGALSSAEIRLLAEIGFMACRARDVKAAMAIFTGLRELRPDRAFVFIGLAMARMSADRPEEAVHLLLDEGLKAIPHDAELLLFLALAQQAAQRESESRRVLAGLVSRADAPAPLRKLASSLLAAEGPGLPTPAYATAMRKEHQTH